MIAYNYPHLEVIHSNSMEIHVFVRDFQPGRMNLDSNGELMINSHLEDERKFEWKNAVLSWISVIL